MKQNKLIFTISKSEVDVYLDEPTIDDDDDDDDYEDSDVLKYWNELSIPIITMASKLAFIKSRQVLSKYGSFILHYHVQMLFCTQSWLYFFWKKLVVSLYISIFKITLQ